ncbi:MAG: type II secretion system F family protein [Coriobacteriales bacterium]|jgi:type IV pilus assembly protein PilC|nr:type II secretion system F family protein [Coriobacteriales bacterium]
MAAKTLTAGELELFFANLELVYHSGLPLTEGFDILRNNAQSPGEAARMQAMYQAALAGASLHEALVNIGELPQYALALIRIGEQTGRMEETFASLHDYYEKRDVLSQSIRSSLTYPLSMLVVVIAIIVVLLTQAMPVFNQVFLQLGFQMTGLAAALMSVGSAISSSAVMIVILIAALVVIALVLRLFPVGKRFYSALFQSMPITRGLSLSLSTQRFAIALASLLKSGLDVSQALEYAEPLVDDKRARLRIANMKKSLNDGFAFMDALEQSKLFPPTSMALLAVGFKTGSDSEALQQVGEQITAQTENRMDSMVSAIEPTLVAVMCVLVGMILLSVMLPLLGVLTGL